MLVGETADLMVALMAELKAGWLVVEMAVKRVAERAALRVGSMVDSMAAMTAA